MSKKTTNSRAGNDILDAATTRARLELIWGKAFDPEALGSNRLHPTETARFIADQMRKLRIAALQSGHTALVWMIESTYYEAYTLGCGKFGLEPEPERRRA